MIETKPIQTDRPESNSAGSAITAEQHREGYCAVAIERQTAKLPSSFFLLAAGAAAAGSLVLEIAGLKDKSRFVGQWVAPILICGVYNKIVKTQGSDRLHSEEKGSTKAGDADGGRRSSRLETSDSPHQSGPPAAAWQR